MKRYFKSKMSTLIGMLIVCALTICSLFSGMQPAHAASNQTLRNTYGEYLGHVGNCVSLNQLRDQTTLSHIKSQYNSITLENEMKPDALLGGRASLITVAEAKNLGYYIPSNYKQSYVPRINFNTVDQVLKICYENGLGVRAHTLVWHSQTPSWFFKGSYSDGNGYVSASEMDTRMEFYIKTVMNHVYSSQYGKVVYAWDVVNEYLHAVNSGWEAVYGKCGTKPAFVKRAYEYAYDCLSYYKLTGSVSLFFNDFNTYMEVNDVINVVKYINSDKKICNGVGMQSHLGTNYPSVAYYTQAMQSFVNAGFEVQITELDVTNSSASEQANYLYNLMTNVLKIKKAGGNITGMTIWGLCDQVSWISGGKNPLLFSTINSPKESYYKVIQAYNDVSPTPIPTPTPTPVPPVNKELKDGWYYIKNINAQKYLQVTNNQGGNGVNVEIGTGTGVQGQKWYVKNTSDGYITLQNGQGYMLDIVYGENKDGSNVQTYSANGADAQQFKLSPSSAVNTFGILTKASSATKALDVYGNGTADGTNVCQWTYHDGNNQHWVFEACNN